jgi:hypothetical protein
MNWIRPILGYTFAFAMLPIALTVFFAFPQLEQFLATTSGLEVSPHFTGGEVAFTIRHDGYTTQIHRPVFDGLFRDRKQGFVQIDWTPVEALPKQIDEPIDTNNDGRPDFHIRFAPGEEPVLSELGKGVVGLEGSYRVHDAWVIRVGLEK